MNKSDLEKGWIPLKGEKKKLVNWKYIVGSALFLLTFYALKDTIIQKKHQRFNEQVEEKGRAVLSTLDGLSLEDQEYVYNLRNKVVEIYSKYLTPDENKDFTEICGKQGEGGTTPDEYNRATIYSNKVKSSASPEQKDTINEFNRLIQKMAGNQK